MTIPDPPFMTADDILTLHLPHRSTELVRGRLLVREPPSTYHGRLSARLTRILDQYADEHTAGAVFGQDTGFQIAVDPDTVRGADVAFLSKAREALIPARGYAQLAPDLVVEIVSPGDRPGEVLAKVADWLGAGTALVWVIDPAHREVRVYRADGSLAIVRAGGALDGEAVLPGFRCPLASVFA